VGSRGKVICPDTDVAGSTQISLTTHQSIKVTMQKNVLLKHNKEDQFRNLICNRKNSTVFPTTLNFAFIALFVKKNRSRSRINITDPVTHLSGTSNFQQLT